MATKNTCLNFASILCLYFFTDQMTTDNGLINISREDTVRSGYENNVYSRKICPSILCPHTPKICSDRCKNTRDSDPDGWQCVYQIKQAKDHPDRRCSFYLDTKECDCECNLCMCSTGNAHRKEHCNGRGTCKARCKEDYCDQARCICEPGYEGNWCENKVTTTTTASVKTVTTVKPTIRGTSHGKSDFTRSQGNTTDPKGCNGTLADYYSDCNESVMGEKLITAGSEMVTGNKAVPCLAPLLLFAQFV